MLSQKRKRVTRSISAENPTGAKNEGAKAIHGPGEACAKRLGPGWKISPCLKINLLKDGIKQAVNMYEDMIGDRK